MSIKQLQKVSRFAAFFQVKAQKNKVEDLVLANHKEVSRSRMGRYWRMGGAKK